MDRPAGPRQPDKRNEAYESIFGRPSASHHQAGQYPGQHVAQQLQYAQSIHGMPVHGAQYHNQPYPAHYQHDRRTSHSQPQNYYPNHLPQHPQQHLQSPYRQSYPHTAVSQQQLPAHHHAQYTRPHTLAPPMIHGRTRSVVSSPHAAGIISPLPDDPPDESLEALTRAGLTPAQAYQAQVYRNRPTHQQQPNGQPDSTREPSLNGNHHRVSNDVPRLGVNLDLEDTRFNIDFGTDDQQGPEGSTSELPWAIPDTGADAREYTPMAPFPKAQQYRQASPLSIASDQSNSSASSRPQPLQLDTTLMSTRNSLISTSPASSSRLDHAAASKSRRSSDSVRTMPGTAFRRDRAPQDRSMSMSAASGSVRTMIDRGSRAPNPFMAEGRNSPTTSARLPRRAPIVYPALLSRVAEAFRERINLQDRLKDGLTYKDAFDGREAVDKISYIIKTTDRNLALLLGRALDAQKFFHDVTYDHRLRDSAAELYQFRTHLSPFVSGELPTNYGDRDDDGDLKPERPSPRPQDCGSGPFGQGSNDSHADTQEKDASPIVEIPDPHGPQDSESIDEMPLPSGVFTLLTDCYSPTCTRDHLCYSIACPRRLEQQSRLNMKPQPGLKKQISRESLGDFVEPGTLWIHSVPQEVVNSVSDAEKRRQEAINEVIYTERDFVRDMEYLCDVWINGLKDSDIIPAERRADFVTQVFWNIHEIIAVNTRLRDALNKRQKSYAVVERIGDILLDSVPHFAPFVSYGAHQLYGKYEFEKEKSSNPAFAQFVETTERLPESRKLELNGYLTKPTTRLARYPLLLEAVLKQTPDDNPDKQTLAQVVIMVREFLGKVNVETGKTENRFNLLQLDQQLVYRPGEQVDLKLQDPGRELVYKGALNKRGGGQGDSGDLLVYLFDHALLMVKQKSKHEQFKVYRRPIPLELLFVHVTDESNNSHRPANARQGHKTLTKKNSFNRGTPYAPAIPIKVDGKSGFAITFIHLGRKYYQMTLWASTFVSHRKWVETITKQQESLRERSAVFETITLCEGFFLGQNRVNCAAPFAYGRRIVYGTDDGIYLSDLNHSNRDPVKVLALLDVSQVDVLEEFQLLIVLSERQVITFPLDALDPMDPMSGLKRAKKISSHTTFFKAGICLGKVLVCIVKSSPLSSTIKTLEPIDQNIRGRSKPTFRKILQGGNDTLKAFREFYIPVESSSIHFLKTKLCVGCTKGFEIVDLESLDTQGLLDPADASLDFVRKRENLRPMAIYRVDNEFLLCYDEFAFYVNKNGWRSRQDFMVHWEGSPTGFALRFPYVLAFEPTFVEIRHVETGLMSQVIQGNNLRLLFADMPPSATHLGNAQQNQYYGQQGYSPYQHPTPSVYGQGYGSPAHSPQSQHARYIPSGRDEILMVSDDRVLTLRMTVGSHVTCDTASLASSR
ncbi:CNH domain-containing protein [Suillus subaureus]|uniref:CNH domain-containing protein n=1 Tax=Suillus subaureus TaxID=48587 RepID=A0A9P7E1F2_9AGAM|nr:CNH domain-containing protein [Suillus subaureus]KAG1808641.1 CNH domain-containing protein [Suillus subaureus]